MSRKTRARRSDAIQPAPSGHLAPAGVSDASGETSPGRLRILLLGAALVAITIAVYAPVRHFDFVQVDDPQQVIENPQVASGLTWPAVVWAFTGVRAGYWMPLVWLSHMADVQVYGMNAGGHHVTNVALHIVCTLLLFGLLLQFERAAALDGSASQAKAVSIGGRSAFVAALFAVHPVHVESVAWITERKDVLSTVFWMLTLWAYVWWTRRGGGQRYAVVALLFALGLMAKPMLVTLPLVMLLLDWWPLRRAGGASRASGAGGWRALVLEKVPLFVLAAAGGIVAIVTQQASGAMSTLQVYPLGLRVSNALVSYVAYIGKMFWPTRLTILYSFPSSIPAASVAGAVVVLVIVSFVVWRLASRRPYLAVGWLWYLVTLLPVIGLVQVGVQGMADRFTYVPFVGLFIMIAWGVPDLFATRAVTRRVVVPAAAALVVLACAWTARAQVGYWKDNVTLWTHTTEIELHLDAYHAHMSLGAALREQNRLDEASAHFAEAARLNPASADSHSELATVLLRQGKPDQAIAHYQEALRLQPGVAETHNNLGTVLGQQGRFDEAIAHFSEAARLKPDLEIAHANLAVAYVKIGRPQDAQHEFNEVLRINPANEMARRATGR